MRGIEAPSLSERLFRFAADLECGWWWNRRRTVEEMRMLAAQLQLIERAEREPVGEKP